MKIVRLCLILTAILLTARPGLADEILGTWLRDSGDEQVKFEPCGDAICGIRRMAKTRLGFERQSREAPVLRRAAQRS